VVSKDTLPQEAIRRRFRQLDKGSVKDEDQ
jgi:hypothetical protein